jgi:hypothetical protein
MAHVLFVSPIPQPGSHHPSFGRGALQVDAPEKHFVPEKAGALELGRHLTCLNRQLIVSLLQEMGWYVERR